MKSYELKYQNPLIAKEKFHAAGLPNQVKQGDYQQQPCPACVVQKAELAYRKYSRRRYNLQPIAADQGAYWQRRGDCRPKLVDSRSGEPVPEWRRGYQFSDFYEMLLQDYAIRPLVFISFGDCGVNKGRGLLTRDSLSWVCEDIAVLGNQRPWLVEWRSGYISAEWMAVEAEFCGGRIVPLCCTLAHEQVDVLGDINWALTGLPVFVDRKLDKDVVFRLDDDLRHRFELPQMSDGRYLLERSLLDAREHGWVPGDLLTVDLSAYGKLDDSIQALLRANYRHVYQQPMLEGEFQLVDDGHRMLILPRESGYGVSVFGLCRDGSFGVFQCHGRPVSGRGYFAPSVASQLAMLDGEFEYGWILDEGLDCSYWDVSMGITVEEFPVRGTPGGLLAGILCIYEKAAV